MMHERTRPTQVILHVLAQALLKHFHRLLWGQQFPVALAIAMESTGREQ